MLKKVVTVRAAPSSFLLAFTTFPHLPKHLTGAQVWFAALRPESGFAFGCGVAISPSEGNGQWVNPTALAPRVMKSQQKMVATKNYGGTNEGMVSSSLGGARLSLGAELRGPRKWPTVLPTVLPETVAMKNASKKQQLQGGFFGSFFLPHFSQAEQRYFQCFDQKVSRVVNVFRLRF